jgi:signal transduction histidine kinase
MNKLELLAEEDNLSEGHIQNIGEINQILERLSNINRSLLLLSKIENKQFIEHERLSINAIFKDLMNEFSDYASYRKVKIRLIEEGEWFRQMNRDLAGILATNLLKNAIVHNHSGGELIIKIGSSGFTIENTSHDPALEPDKLFERFNNNPNKQGSVGLGLAIVKAIADASDLTVSYSYAGRHVIRVSQ